MKILNNVNRCFGLPLKRMLIWLVIFFSCLCEISDSAFKQFAKSFRFKHCNDFNQITFLYTIQIEQFSVITTKIT